MFKNSLVVLVCLVTFLLFPIQSVGNSNDISPIMHLLLLSGSSSRLTIESMLEYFDNALVVDDYSSNFGGKSIDFHRFKGEGGDGIFIASSSHVGDVDSLIFKWGDDSICLINIFVGEHELNILSVLSDDSIIDLSLQDFVHGDYGEVNITADGDGRLLVDIPKEMIDSLSGNFPIFIVDGDVKTYTDFAVIDDDPLFVWHFEDPNENGNDDPDYITKLSPETHCFDQAFFTSEENADNLQMIYWRFIKTDDSSWYYSALDESVECNCGNWWYDFQEDVAKAFVDAQPGLRILIPQESGLDEDPAFACGCVTEVCRELNGVGEYKVRIEEVYTGQQDAIIYYPTELRKVENFSSNGPYGVVGIPFEIISDEGNSDIYNIPVRSILVDGLAGDWLGISPIAIDITGDSICETGTDIKNFYLAKDNTYLYWRVDTATGSFSFGSPGAERILVLVFYEKDAPNGPYPNGITVNLNGPTDAYISGKYDNYDWTGLYGGPEYGQANQVAEGKILLSNFDPFKIEYVVAYYWHAPDADPQCDEVFRFGDPNLN